MVEVAIHCPARLECIEYLDAMCQLTLMQAAFPQYKRFGFAVHEAVINAVEATLQRYGPGYPKPITVEIKATREEATATIADQAGGIPDYHMEKLERVTLEDLALEERGRGLLLIKHFVDDLWYTQGQNGNYIIGMRKRG